MTTVVLGIWLRTAEPRAYLQRNAYFTHSGWRPWLSFYEISYLAIRSHYLFTYMKSRALVIHVISILICLIKYLFQIFNKIACFFYIVQVVSYFNANS